MKHTLSFSLEQSFGQHKVLNQTVQAGIKLLLLPTQEFNQEIEKYCLENPYLELVETESSSYHSSVNFNELENPSSLVDHLISQIQCYPCLNENDKKKCMKIIYSLDESGYLINEQLDDEEEKLLPIIHSLDPIGCGARSINECLRIQVKAKDHPLKHYALTFLENKKYLILLENNKQELMSLLQINNDILDEIIQLIKKCLISPAEKFVSLKNTVLIPDLILKVYKNDDWKLSLNNNLLRVRYNSSYDSIKLKELDRNDYEFMIKRKEFANFIIKSIQLRNQNLLNVTKNIIHIQQEFFFKGNQYLKPMVLKDIANVIGVHESTVSRAVNNKYIYTPRGTFELKYFFNKNVSNITKNELKNKIKYFFSDSNKTDLEIVSLLNNEGIKISRRTVTNYRKDLDIPSKRYRTGGVFYESNNCI